MVTLNGRIQDFVWGGGAQNFFRKFSLKSPSIGGVGMGRENKIKQILPEKKTYFCLER